MLWFEGSVPEAIAESKRIKSVFVVYIKGDDDESKKMNVIWENGEIKAASSRDCTAIQLHVNSLEGKQFASLYPVVCIPCTYFIDGNGVPLEVIGGFLPGEQFLDKMKKTIENHRTKFPKVEPECSSPSSLSSQAESSQSNEPVVDGNDSSPALAERVARAKKRIEEKRTEKQEKENEDVRRKEIERRKEGQQLSKAKVERQEKLVHQMAERVRQEKAKDKAAREAVRQKIAQDKAERAARLELEKEERRHLAARIDPRVNANDPTVQCSDVRLQFRFADGSSVMQSFPVDAHLETAREFISSTKKLTKRITFWTTFPRRHLSEEDYPRTLGDLGLAPSAALIVDMSSPASTKSSGDSLGSLSSIIAFILAPFLAALSFLKLLLFASPQESRGAPIQENSKATTSSANTSFSSSQTSDVRRRVRDSSKNEGTFKKEGKIHSFGKGDDDDDENKTWNGNSTQQM